MDPLSFAASLITLVDVAWKLVEYLHGLKEGGNARQKLLKEVTLLWHVLRKLQEEFSPSEEASDVPWMQSLMTLGQPNGILSQIREALIELEEKLVRSSRLGQLKATIVWPFQEKEIQQIIERLDHLKGEATLVIVQSNHQMNQEILRNVTHIQKLADDNYFQAVMSWLSPVNFVQKQKEILQTVVPCSWVLESEEFKLWHNGDVRSLWYYGAPGVGKSVLAASVYEELSKLHKSERVAIIIVFCSLDNECSQSVDVITATILKQTLQTRGDGQIPAMLRELHSRSATGKDERDLTSHDISGLLQEELSYFDSSFIILDGLDEVGMAEQRREIIETIRSFSSQTKVMISSRYSEDITEALTDAQKIQLQAREQDLRDYSSRRINSDIYLKGLLKADETLKPELIDAVIEKSEGIFLLARLHMDSFANCTTVSEIRRTITKLSADLNETYLQTMKRMKKSLSAGREKALRKLFLWVSWTKRPLSVMELEHAMAILPGLDSIDRESIPAIRDMTTWSAGLIFADSKDLVRVIHPTTIRFLIRHRNAMFPNGDSIIAHTCLDYLSLPALREPLRGPDRESLFKLRCQEFPFLKYSVLHSAFHVERSRTKDDDHRMMNFLRSEAKEFFLQALYYLDKSWSVEEQASPLHVASYLGLTDVVRGLIDAGEDVNARDLFGTTPLMYAAERGQRGATVVKCLLSAGADPTLICQDGSTALLRAVSSEEMSVVDLLLQEPDVNINAVPSGSQYLEEPALFVALIRNNKTIFEKLLARGDIDVDTQGREKWGALHYACDYSLDWAIEALLSHPDISVDLQDDGRWTPLFYATVNGSVKGVEVLMKHGARADLLDNNRGTALMRAIDNNQVDTARYLISHGQNVNHKDFLGRTLLHSASVNRSWKCLTYLLQEEKSLNVNSQGVDGETALHDACRHRDPTGVKILVSNGARCDIRDKSGMSPMDIAMVNGNDEILDILKSAEGYSNLTATLPRKPLLEAIKSDDSEILRKRIATESRENLNTVSAFIGTPLSMACKHARSDVVLMLLHAGADPNIYDRFGRTPLFNAIFAGSLSCVQALASNGADINDDLPIRPWEHSVKRNRKEIALYLIENGAYIRHNSPSLQTTLHIAVEKDNLTAVRRLVDAGASIHLKDKGEGYAAINLARKYNATKTLDYFSQLPVVSSSHEIDNEEVDEVAHEVEKIEDAQNNSHESSIPLKGDPAAGTAGRATGQILRAKVHLPIQFSLLGFLLCIGFLMALYPYILFKK